jgi:hypothetical protein
MLSSRNSFSDLPPSSSGGGGGGGLYSTANCCQTVPELCTRDGRCALSVTDCVSFCICAQSPSLHWCDEELQRLRQVG